MFMVSAEAADAIRTTFLEKGEWPAVAELRRFYRIDDNESALRSVRIIASWLPMSERLLTTRTTRRKAGEKGSDHR